MKNSVLLRICAGIIFLLSGSCHDRCEKSKGLFEREFSLKLPDSIEFQCPEQRDGYTIWFQFHFPHEEFEGWSGKVSEAGYSEWRKIPNTYHISFGKFNVVGSDDDPVIIADKFPQGPGGKIVFLTYRLSNQEFNAVSFR